MLSSRRPSKDVIIGENIVMYNTPHSGETKKITKKASQSNSGILESAEDDDNDELKEHYIISDESDQYATDTSISKGVKHKSKKKSKTPKQEIGPIVDQQQQQQTSVTRKREVAKEEKHPDDNDDIIISVDEIPEKKKHLESGVLCVNSQDCYITEEERDTLSTAKLILNDVVNRYQKRFCPRDAKKRRDIFFLLAIVFAILVSAGFILSLLLVSGKLKMTAPSHSPTLRMDISAAAISVKEQSPEEKQRNQDSNFVARPGSGTLQKNARTRHQFVQNHGSGGAQIIMRKAGSLSQKMYKWKNRIDFEKTMTIGPIATTSSDNTNSTKNENRKRNTPTAYHHKYYDIRYPPDSPSGRSVKIPNFSSGMVSSYSLCCDITVVSPHHSKLHENMNEEDHYLDEENEEEQTHLHEEQAHHHKISRKCANRDRHIFCLLENNSIMIRAERKLFIDSFGEGIFEDETEPKSFFFLCNLLWNNDEIKPVSRDESVEENRQEIENEHHIVFF